MSHPPSESADHSSDQHLAEAKDAGAHASEELKQAAGAKASEIRTAAQAGLQQLREAAGDKVADLSEAAKAGVQQFREIAGQKAAELKQHADKTWSAVRDQSKEVTTQAIDYTREKPFRVVALAFGIGLLVGLLTGPTPQPSWRR